MITPGVNATDDSEPRVIREIPMPNTLRSFSPPKEALCDGHSENVVPPALEARPIGEFLSSVRTCLHRVRIGKVHVLRSGAVIFETAAGIHVTRPPGSWEMLRAHAERLTGPLFAPKMYPCGICVLGGWFITDRAFDAATGEIWLTMANILDGSTMVLSGDVIGVLNM